MSVSGFKYSGYNQNYSIQRTGLYITTHFSLFRPVEELLSKLKKKFIISVNRKDSRDKTPLLLTAKNGHNTMLKLLFNNSAEVNAQNKDGNVL